MAADAVTKLKVPTNQLKRLQEDVRDFLEDQGVQTIAELQKRFTALRNKCEKLLPTQDPTQITVLVTTHPSISEPKYRVLKTNSGWRLEAADRHQPFSDRMALFERVKGVATVTDDLEFWRFVRWMHPTSPLSLALLGPESET